MAQEVKARVAAFARQLTEPSAHDRKVWMFDAMMQAFMPRVLRGANGRRVCWNLWHGGSRMRSFCRSDGGPIVRALASWADRFGCVPRTLRARTMLGLAGLKVSDG